MVRLRAFDPSGASRKAEYRHAPRLSDLHGKTIGEVSTGLWEYDRVFPFVRKLLQERFPDIRFVTYSELPTGLHVIDTSDIADVVAARGCDAVIGGPSG